MTKTKKTAKRAGWTGDPKGHARAGRLGGLATAKKRRAAKKK